MHQPRFLARGLLVSFLLIALLAAPGALTFTWAGAAAVEQAGTNTPTATGTPSHTATATSTVPSLGKFTGLQAAPVRDPAGLIVISQFRSLGPGGTEDEFIELFNPTAASVPIVGWTLSRSDCSGATTPTPAPTALIWIGAVTLLSGQHYLISGTGYTGIVAPDAPVPISLPDSGGIALMDGSSTIIDQAGTCNTSGYFEGTALPPLSGTLDQVYERKALGGVLGCMDTNNNSGDFALIVPSLPHNMVSTKTPCPVPTAVPPPTPITPTATLPPDCILTPTPAGLPGYPQRSVLINEVGWAGTSASTADKWIELRNTNPSCPVNLYGWHLYGQSSSGTVTITFVNTDVIQAVGAPNSADYFVIVRYAGTFNNVLENKIDSGLSLVTSGQTLYLRGPSGELVDSANCYDTTCNGAASSSWPAGRSSPPTSMERYYNPPTNTQDVPEDWVTYGGSTAAGDPTHPQRDRNNNVVRGTPGRENWANQPGNAPTAIPPTAKVRKPTPIPPTPFAHMLINEFLPRAGTDWNRDGAINVYDEFIELKNLGPISVNLSSWRLDDAANPLHSYTLPSMTLKSGDRALFYRSTTQIPLPDGGGTVRLLNPSGIIFDARGYGPVASPDVSHCRIPDGFYWQDACFPTPGIENSLTGAAAVAPPIPAVLPPPCLLPDTAPQSFRLGECAPYGSDIWDRTYWDDPAGNLEYLVQDVLSKWKTIVQ